MSLLNKIIYDDYFENLRNGNSFACTQIVEGLLNNQIDIRELYTELFQKSLYQIGSLWEQNKISVAREHLATAITDRLMNLVYPRLFSNPTKERKRAVISCAANEYHQIGGKMVADILELNRWDTHFLGANTPIDHLLQHIEEESTTLVGLSLSVYFNFPSILQMIERVRTTFPSVTIVVGGQGFRHGGVERIHSFTYTNYYSSVYELENAVGKGDE